RLAAGTGRRQAGVAVVHVASVNAHAVRIGIGRRRELHDLEDLPRIGIELLNEPIAREQAPDAAVIPVEAVGTVALDRNDPDDAHRVAGIELHERVDVQRRRPERARLVDPDVAVHAAAPRWTVRVDRLSGVDVGLNDLAERPVTRTRRTPAADAAVRIQPEI